MELETGMALINFAREKERDERIFRQWVSQLPFMGEKTFISFDDYRARVTGSNIDTRPTAEIMAELDSVENQLGRRCDE